MSDTQVILAGFAALTIGFIFSVKFLMLVGFLVLAYAGWRSLGVDRD